MKDQPADLKCNFSFLCTLNAQRGCALADSCHSDWLGSGLFGYSLMVIELILLETCTFGEVAAFFFQSFLGPWIQHCPAVFFFFFLTEMTELFTVSVSASERVKAILGEWQSFLKWVLQITSVFKHQTQFLRFLSFRANKQAHCVHWTIRVQSNQTLTSLNLIQFHLWINLASEICSNGRMIHESTDF